MSETYRLPDGPKTPELFNGLSFLLFRNRAVKKWQRRYGDTFSVRMPGFGQMVLVTTPDLVKQVYTAKADVLHGGKNPLGEILGPGSLFSMDEDRHLKERRMLLPPFHGERMRSYEAIIEEEAEAGDGLLARGGRVRRDRVLPDDHPADHPAHRVRRRGPRAGRTGEAAAADDDDRPAPGDGADPAPRPRPAQPRRPLEADARRVPPHRRQAGRRPPRRPRARPADRHPGDDAAGAASRTPARSTTPTSPTSSSPCWSPATRRPPRRSPGRSSASAATPRSSTGSKTRRAARRTRSASPPPRRCCGCAR